MLTLIGTFIMKILSILLFSLFSLTLQAEDDLNFFKSQHNLGVTHGQYGINYRIYFDDNASEVEFKYKPIKNLQAHIKIAEDDLLQENRYRLTHTIGKYFDTKFSHRIEFRHFEGNKDDYWRYRLIVGKDFLNKLVWFKVQPKFTFGHSKKDDSKVDEIEYELGLSFKLNSETTFKPYLEYKTKGADDDYEKKHLIFATALNFKF